MDSGTLPRRLAPAPLAARAGPAPEWVALRTEGAGILLPDRAGALRRSLPDLPQGSLVALLDAGGPALSGQSHRQRLRLHCGPDGTYLNWRTADASHSAILPPAQPGQSALVMLSWDQLTRSAIFAQWQPGDCAPAICEFALDQIPSRDLLATILNQGSHTAGLAHGRLPAGPLPGFSESAVVATERGERAIGTLRPGDFVLTATGRAAPVLWCGALELPTWGPFAPMRLRAPYLGLTRDLELGATQELSLAGADVEYLFNATRVCAPIAHFRARPETSSIKPKQMVRRYVGVMLDQAHQIIVNGGTFETVAPKPLMRDPLVAKYSLMAQIPAALYPMIAPNPEPRPPRLSAQELDSLMQFRGR